MNNKSLSLGVLITGICLAIIILFWLFGGLETPKSLNELRNFLAGIFCAHCILLVGIGIYTARQTIRSKYKNFATTRKSISTAI